MTTGTPAVQAAPRRRRADAERNIRRILEAAETLVQRDGADASIEEIARLAGVGPATLYRHFPSRMALMEALFSGRMDALCENARVRAHEADADDALIAWLHAVIFYLVDAQGMLAALTMRGNAQTDAAGNFEAGVETLMAAASELVDEAVRRGVVRPDLTPQDVIDIIVGFALALDKVRPSGIDLEARADRLLDLAMRGMASRTSTP